jgi:phosphonate transport system permease protein
VILLLVGLIAALDRAVAWVRARPRCLLAVLPLGLACVAALAPRSLALDHAAQVVGEMFSPALDRASWAELPALVAQTLTMALAATAAAALLALPLALAASRRMAPRQLRLPVRHGLDLLRAVPELVWGLVLVATVGIGPTAGAVALGLHSLGSLGRLFADALDTAPLAPQQALQVTGARPLAVTAFATLPLAAPAIIAHTIFRFEWNLRMATVLGLIGAGGIGQALYHAQQLFFYDQALAYVAVTATLILAVDALGRRLRKGLRLDEARDFAQSRRPPVMVRACA